MQKQDIFSDRTTHQYLLQTRKPALRCIIHIAD